MFQLEIILKVINKLATALHLSRISCVCDNKITDEYDLQIIVPVYKVEQ